MDSQILTLSHVIISLIGIVSGLVVAYGLVTGQRMPVLTATFLVTTVATSVTGFVFFHRDHLLPSHILGIISLVVLVPAIYGLYVAQLKGVWRSIYVVGAVASLYFNVFVLIIQSFQKVPALHALAPTQTSEPAFAGAQGAALLLFILIGFLSLKRFHPAIA